MSNKIIFYSPRFSNRLTYTVHLVFTEILGLDVFFTQNCDVYLASQTAKVHYDDEMLKGDTFFIKKHNFIFENQIIKRDFDKEFHDFDIFSKIFFLVSRYEEYIADTNFRASDTYLTTRHTEGGAIIRDKHGRFPASASILKRMGMLHQPVVNQWVMDLKQSLLTQFPYLETQFLTNSRTEQSLSYRVQLTYDIDQAWAFKNKGIVRNIGGFLTDLFKAQFKNVWQRILVFSRLSEDPQYTFSYIEKLHQKYEGKIETPVFFWLLGDYGKFDKNINWQAPSLQRLIRRLAKKYKTGIHPSYASNDEFEKLKNERSRLQNILKNVDAKEYSSDTGITLSRQHFLKLQFPETYRRLIKAGICADYSMGYADDIGFRAGIATPFYWYDLEQEQTTHLRIYPFQIMEVTLKEYLKLPIDEAVAYVKPLIQSVKKVNGTLTLLWHNTSLSDTEGYEGWRIVYEKVLEEAIVE